MPVILYISRATYYRLLIPQILSEDIHKVLFLDCDIIVRHSLRPLWESLGRKALTIPIRALS